MEDNVGSFSSLNAFDQTVWCMVRNIKLNTLKTRAVSPSIHLYTGLWQPCKHQLSCWSRCQSYKRRKASMLVVSGQHSWSQWLWENHFSQAFHIFCMKTAARESRIHFSQMFVLAPDQDRQTQLLLCSIFLNLLSLYHIFFGFQT